MWKRLLWTSVAGMVLLAALAGCGRQQEESPRLRMYAGAGLRPALEQVVDAYEQQTGTVVEVDYAGSGIAMSRAKLDPKADLFLPGDVSYVRPLEKTGLIEEITDVTWFVPVMIVARGNPKNVQSVADFARPDVRVGLGNPDVPRVGKVAEKILARYGQNTDALAENGRVMQSMTVNELGVWVKTGRVDAAIVWDAIAANHADATDVVRIPPEKNVISTVAVGRMSTAVDPARARGFVEFVTGPTAREIFREKGYRVEAPEGV